MQGMKTEDQQIAFEPLDFNKTRQKGRNHRRTQSNTAFDLCGLLNINQSKPEVIKQIAENYHVPDGTNTQRILEAQNQRQDEKQTIVEDIMDIPKSTAIVPRRSSAHNPMNFVKKRNLSCGAPIRNPDIYTPKTAINYDDLNDIIGLNIIAERKNSVESSDDENDNYEIKSDRQSPNVKDQRTLTRRNSIMDLRSSLEAAKGNQEPKLGAVIQQGHFARFLQKANLKTNDASKKHIPYDTAAESYETPQQKQALGSSKPKGKPSRYEQSNNYQQQQESISQKRAGREVERPLSNQDGNIFTIDTSSQQTTFVRDRSTSKSATPTNIATYMNSSGASQTNLAVLNKSATNGSTIKASPSTPFTLPKKISPTEAKNFLKVLCKRGKTGNEPGQELMGSSVADSSQDKRAQSSFIEIDAYEKSTSKSDVRTPMGVKRKEINDKTDSKDDRITGLENKIFGLEEKIDGLLARNNSLEEQNAMLLKLVEKLTSQCQSLQLSHNKVSDKVEKLENSLKQTTGDSKIKDPISRKAKENIPQCNLAKEQANSNLFNTADSSNSDSPYGENQLKQQKKNKHQVPGVFTMRDMNLLCSGSNRPGQDHTKPFEQFVQEYKNNIIKSSTMKQPQRKSQVKNI